MHNSHLVYIQVLSLQQQSIFSHVQRRFLPVFFYGIRLSLSGKRAAFAFSFLS